MATKAAARSLRAVNATTRSNPASEDLFVEKVADMPENFLRCRSVQHDWESSPFVVVDTRYEERLPRQGQRRFAERRHACKNCGKVRSDAYAITTRNGHTSLKKLNSTYSKVAGYDLQGTGNTAGMRDLLLGVLFDKAMANK